MTATRRIILASTSPRRRDLLRLGGWEFSTIKAEVNEDPFPGEDPIAYVKRLAQAKAETGWRNAGDTEAVVIGADTTVIADGGIMGKPADEAEAFAMLAGLRARVHQVVTAVAITHGNECLQVEVGSTDVGMRNYNDAEIHEYIATGDPMDKAGAYAIQHPGFHPAEFTRGCYANVVGLPVCLLAKLLRSAGVPEPAGIHLTPPCSEDEAQRCLVCNTIRQENA